MGGEREGPLFESKGGKGRVLYRVYAASVLVGVFLIWVYRAVHMPKERGRWWIWIGVFGAEIWFGLYWVLTQSVRWNPIYHQTFKDRLSQRYENELPSVDIFVCTADPTIEPPVLVINTILSVMAYDYPPEKLNVYLSDDGGSVLTFHALLEAASFAKHWIPYCTKFNVETRSPTAYFSLTPSSFKSYDANEYSTIKNLYTEMENRIKDTIESGGISGKLAKQHKGFSEWKMENTPENHQPIVEILIDRRDPKNVDVEGMALPTLVYVAREKRPQHHHNFKAGALNALIRVSSKISDAPFILFVDCDMCTNSSDTLRDALCFFMDEKNGHEISYVQFPANFRNLHKTNIYGDYIEIINQVEFPGFEQALLVGTGCFHRRESLCGRTYNKDRKVNYNKKNELMSGENTPTLEERAKSVASCTCEDSTAWGKDMGMMYGCPVEDVITGLSIQCKGWRSIFYNPPKKSFLGLSPLTLGQLLVQHKRWSDGMFQIFLSKYCPPIYGCGKIKLRLQMAYSLYLLWAPMSLPILYYSVVPSLCLLEGISLFPKVSSSWFLPFAYVIIATQAYSLSECLWCGETVMSWWNMHKMRMMRRTTSYLFSFIDTILLKIGFGKSGFAITVKVADDDALERYEKGLLEFGSHSPMFVVLALLVMLNLVCFAGGVIRLAMELDGGWRLCDQMALQFMLCGVLVMGNMPVYQALFFRRDKGSLPTSVAFQSLLLAGLACLGSTYFV